MIRLIVSTLIFLAVFWALMWPSETIRTTYARGLRSVAGFFISTVGEHGRVEFEPNVSASGKDDSIGRLWNTRTGSSSGFDFSTRMTGYIPTALVFSLTLALPFPWRRMWKSMLIGLIAVNAFVLLRLWLTVSYVFSTSPTLEVIPMGTMGRTLLAFLFSMLAVSSAGNFVVPVVIWAVCSFRRADWQRLSQRMQKRMTAPAPEHVSRKPT